MNLSFLKEKKNKYVVIGLLGLLFLVFMMPTSTMEEEGNVATVENVYEKELETQLKRVLSAMEGVGEVEVMITFEQQENSLFGTNESTGKVCGVLIVAQGAGNAVVEKRILDAVKALFDVEAHKISIVKRAK